VHTGWDEVETRRTKRVADLPVIPFDKVTMDGAHAFALVGYTPEGFIVQNSWGPDWGHNGFAVMRYEDWLKNGTDAWVAVMGAPRQFQVTPGAYATAHRPALAARGAGAAATIAGAAKDLHPGVWDDATVLRHTIILGNNGRAERRNIAHRDGAEAVHSVAQDALLAWAKSRSEKTVKVALYAHGGLNSEASSLKRVAVLGPWFATNGIFPVFFTWRTGAKETILNMLEDALPKFLRAEPDFTPAGGVGDWFKKQLEKLKERSVDAMDYAVEGACREFLVRGGWSEMKENAAGASDIEGGGLALTVAGLKKVADALTKAGRKLEIHLAGHSAGSILHGHLGGVLMGAGLSVSSCHLYAAACTVDFANAAYFMRRGPGAVFDAAKCAFHVHHLSEKAERDDTVGPVYRKSLLYLICRALETWHKTPLLGMEAVWNPAYDAKKVFNKLWTGPGKAIAWLRANSAGITQHVYDTTHKVSDGETTKPPTHGAFDNDCTVLNHTLGVIAGQPLTRQVTWLAGY
jgi:Papain family cysteine protease